MQLNSILFICGTPRSGTTWLHDILIKHGVFNGIIAEPMEHRSLSLQTNEYRPSIAPGVFYGFRNDDKLLKQLEISIQNLAEKFGKDGKLMLKAPHYAFCVNAFRKIYGEKAKFLFMERDPLSVCYSMSKHPLIKRQLAREPHKCGEFFNRSSNLFRKTVDVLYSHKEVFEFAERNWRELLIHERALLKWHYFSRAFYTTASNMKEEYKICIKYEDFYNTPIVSEKMSSFISCEKNIIEKAIGGFNPTSPHYEISELSKKGKEFYDITTNKVSTF